MPVRTPVLARLMAAASLLVVAAVALAPVAGQAADEHHRAPTVNRRHHARSTGDSQVDRLNESQLDANYRGPWHYMNGPVGSAPPPTPYTPPSPFPRGPTQPRPVGTVATSPPAPLAQPR